MTDTAAWFAERAAGAPPALRVSAAGYLARATAPGTVASRLTDAATLALRDVFDRKATRDAALALLTADSLVTLALLAQAELDPAALDHFASGVVDAAAA
ncbi:MAG: hypothetical protein R2910_12700 [Gemmatimonadales bacterium]